MLHEKNYNQCVKGGTCGRCATTASATNVETDPDRSLRRLFISDWKEDIIVIKRANVGSDGGCDCWGWGGGTGADRDSVGSTSGTVGDLGLASWLGGRTSSNPDHGEPRSCSRRASTGGTGEVSGLSDDPRLSLDTDIGRRIQCHVVLFPPVY